MEKVIFASFASEREERFRLSTQVLERDGRRVVRKSALGRAGKEHIVRLAENRKIFDESCRKSGLFSLNQITAQGDGWMEFEYLSGRTLEKWVDERLHDEDVASVMEMLNRFWQSLMRMSDGPFELTEEYARVFGRTMPGGRILHGASGIDIDLVFTNLFLNEKEPDQLTVTDYEWVFPFSIPMEYVYYRSIFCSVAISKLHEKDREAIYALAGIRKEDLPLFLQTEIAFQNYVTGQTKTMAEHFSRLGKKVYPLVVRSPYSVMIFSGRKAPEEIVSNAVEDDLDLTKHTGETLRVQIGYPFSIITIDTECAMDWECENPDAVYENRYVGGIVPLTFAWKNTGKARLKYRIHGVDELIYQETVKKRILSFGDEEAMLRDQLNAYRISRLGKKVYPLVDRSPYSVMIFSGKKAPEEIVSNAVEDDLDLTKYTGETLRVQIGYPFSIITIDTECAMDWECENPDAVYENRYVGGIVPLTFAWKNTGKARLKYRIHGVDELIYHETVKKRILSFGDEEAMLRDQLNAYRIEWEIMSSEKKIHHSEPAALIRGRQAARLKEQREKGIGPDVTIVIPTKNGGEIFRQVLDRVFSQVTQYTYEVICVDSGSTDGTLQIIQSSSAKLFQIRPEEFGHGKTRNYGASQGTGEFICFLTQDALPVHESWLENMINAMKLDPQIVGGFGRHLPYPGCNFIDERDINGLFDGFGHSNTIYFNEDQAKYESDQGYRSVLAFFSDNNSCLRRSVWEQYPYPDVEFAEDQIWMRQMIERGFKKVYCPEAAVYHSHNYDPSTYFMRYYDEHKGLYEIHGYMNLRHWYYIPAAVVRHVFGDWRYIWGTQNSGKRKLKMLVYSVRRNYARYTAGYIGGHYHLKDEETRKKLDRKYSQQYRQRRGIYGKQKPGIAGKGEETMGRVKNAVCYFKQVYKSEGLLKSLKFMASKTRNVIKNHGINGVFKKIDQVSSQIDIPGFYRYVTDDTSIPLVPAQRDEALRKDTIILNWIIPEVGIGSGGHMTIFRFSSMLEDRGMHNRIYISGATKFTKDEELREFLKANYNITNDRVEVFHSTDSITFAHATIATGWQTAYFVRRFENTLSKYYFVQDFEPIFYPMGSEYLLAENTYKFGFRGITAGEWLKKKIHDEYGMETESFLFSYDRKVFKAGEKRDNKKRLFLYVRPVTPRRCFEIALLALCILHDKMPEIEVIMAGWDVGNYNIPFIHLNAGSITAPELADVYSQCDICIVMSSTNLSLMPIEVMACNSVCACTIGPNNDWMVNENNAIMIPNDPIGIANTLYEALKDPERLAKLRKVGLEFAEHYTTWDNEADKVYRYLEEGIREDIKKL